MKQNIIIYNKDSGRIETIAYGFDSSRLNMLKKEIGSSKDAICISENTVNKIKSNLKNYRVDGSIKDKKKEVVETQSLENKDKKNIDKKLNKPNVLDI